jgi:arylsulfatase A-like enzyme
MNVVLIVTDELNPRHLACYGGKVPTPNLDRLADQGARFTNAHCVAAACTPSRYSVLTGMYPGRCRHPAFLASNPLDQPCRIGWDTWLTRDTPTLVSRLNDAGYFTGHVGKWHVGFDDDREALDLPRFARDADPHDPAVDAELARHQRIICDRIRNVAGFDFVAAAIGENPGYLRTDATNAHQFEWYTLGVEHFLEQAGNRDDPFLLYLAPTALHGPDHAATLERNPRITHGGLLEKLPDGYPTRQSVRDRLEAAGLPVDHETAGITMLDDHVGAVLDRLEAAGLAEQTVVIFVADHGLEPGKATCYQTGLRVPMLVRWPGKTTPGRVVRRPVSHVDILPTILDAAMLVSDRPATDGDSLFSPAVLEDRTLYGEMGRFRSVHDGRWKYIAWRYNADELAAMRTGEAEVAIDAIGRTRQGHSQIAMDYYPHYFDADQLYDLEADPHEQVNLADEPAHAEVLGRLRDDLSGVLGSFAHPYPLEPEPFRGTETYGRLVKRRREVSKPGWWRGQFSFDDVR